MNIHMSAHFPIVAIMVAFLGLAIIGITARQPWSELGKAMLWAGLFAALFASGGSC